MPDLHRWKATWTGLGNGAPDERVFADVVARYAEPDDARDLADRFHELELALWFHDAVYQVRNHDNEERSASWAQSVATNAGLPRAVAERVHGLILATKHTSVPATQDAAFRASLEPTARANLARSIRLLGD